MVNRNKHMLWFGDICTSQFHAFISGSGTFDSTAREYDTYTIPGRNGDLHVDQKRFSNIDVTYPAFIVQDFKLNYRDLRNYLLSQTGYQRLSDDYDLDEFRIGKFNGDMTPEMAPLNRAGSFELVFNCKPQRFLVSGEGAVIFTASGTIQNPTLFEALPLIRVYGTGTVKIGSETLTIATHTTDYIDIDCDIQDCYCGATNCNSYVTLASGEFPTLGAGANGVELGTGITKVEITPRWWRL